MKKGNKPAKLLENNTSTTHSLVQHLGGGLAPPWRVRLTQDYFSLTLFFANSNFSHGDRKNACKAHDAESEQTVVKKKKKKKRSPPHRTKNIKRHRNTANPHVPLNKLNIFKDLLYSCSMKLPRNRSLEPESSKLYP